MKKLMYLAALLALVLVTAVPAIASVSNTGNQSGNINNDPSQANEQSAESGDSSQTMSATGGGDNSNSCQPIEGVSNTGNALQNTNFLQYISDSDLEVDDSGNFEVNPTTTTTCTQTVNQAASASG